MPARTCATSAPTPGRGWTRQRWSARSCRSCRPDRWDGSFELHIGELPSCQADPGLLRLVFINLLDNAMKYTAKRDPAIIEVGCQTDRSPVAYYVQDNGVGFDMRHAHKLFGVFQRLHRSADYDGNGVGLAIVQRIIKRHGGDVWTQAQPEGGATFYFTLPDPPGTKLPSEPGDGVRDV